MAKEIGEGAVTQTQIYTEAKRRKRISLAWVSWETPFPCVGTLDFSRTPNLNTTEAMLEVPLSFGTHHVGAPFAKTIYQSP